MPTVYLCPLSYNEVKAQGGWGSDIPKAKKSQIPPEVAVGGFRCNADGVEADIDEQCSGGKKTDWASALAEVSQTKNAYAITYSLTNIKSGNTSA